MWKRVLLLALLIAVMAGSVQAQTETPLPTLASPPPVFALGPGSTVEGSITDSVAVVRYSFEGRIGDNLSIVMQSTSGTLDPFLTLYGPDAELVEQDDDSGGGRSAAISLTLNRPGRYLVEAGRYTQGGATSTGTFRLSLQVAGFGGSNPDDPLATIPDFQLTPNPILTAYQQTSGGQISAENPQPPYFAFGGQQGDLIRVIMTATSGDLNPRVDLLNRELRSIVSSESQPGVGESIAYATLPATGWYLIQTGTRAGQGRFNLYIERLVAGAVLTPGATVTGEFTQATPTTSYVFNARIGDIIAATLFTTGETNTAVPELRLLNINFETVGRATGNRFVTLRTTIPRSGTYILQVNNQQPTQSGGYNLRLNVVPADIEKLPLTQVTYNDQFRGFIDDNQPVSFFRFSGKAGERVTLQMNTTSGDLDPYLILTGPNLEEELAVNDNVSITSNARIVRFRLEEDGDYFILATRAGLQGGVTSGGFDLLLTAGDIALTPGALSARLSWNSAADLNLFISDPNNETINWTNPQAASGGQMQIDSNTQCDTPTDQPVEYIFWPDGVLPEGDYQIWAWYQNDCANGEATPFSLLVEERKEPVLLSDETSLLPGQRFEVSLRITADGQAFLLDNGRITTPSPQQAISEGGDIIIRYGEQQSGRLDDDVFARFYQFSGQAGDEIQIRVETTAGTLDPVIILRSPDGENLPNGMNDDRDDGSRDSLLHYTLPRTGRYILAVTRFGLREGTTSGSYRLTLEKTNTSSGS